MKYLLSIFFVFSLVTLLPAQKITAPVDTTVVTEHSTRIQGKVVNYKATTGFQPVWDKEGTPIATLYYTFYERTGVAKAKERPLILSFNGGPGAASVWMHMAYTGPKVLNIDDEGNPIQPYGYKENPYSILDVADIVYINPVNTGYSRILHNGEEKTDSKQFFGINNDIKYLADWLSTFVTRNGRWTSPKFLIGESYGGTRVAGLADALQSRQWMYLNGVIMVSPADYKIYSSDGPLSFALTFPYFTAAAWYHEALPSNLQSLDLNEVLPLSEEFAVNELLPFLTKGGFASETDKKKIANKMSSMSGLSEDFILKNNLQVSTSRFWKELLRDREGNTIGRLDSRYLGLDKDDAGERPDFNAELTSWLHSFTPAINEYIREELNFTTDLRYNMFGDVYPWDRTNNNTREQLRKAMATNPYLKVMYQAGYYDGATNYFFTKYTMWQTDPSGKMKDRFSFKAYRSGHMMYLRKEDLEKANEDIRHFISNSLPNGKSAKY